MAKTLVTDLKSDDDFRNFYEKEYYRHSAMTEIPEDGDFMYGVVLEHLKPYLRNGIAAADVGCNNGNLSLYMAKRGCRVLGIDYARNVIEGAKASADFYHIGNAEFKAMDFVKEWNKTDEFDFVFCCNVLEHVREDREFVVKFYQMLKPGGKLLLIIPTVYSSMFRTYKFFTGRFYSDEEVGHLRRYGKKESMDMVESAGFVIDKVNFIDGPLREWFIVHQRLRIFQKIWKLPVIRSAFNRIDSIMAGLHLYPATIVIHGHKKER